MTEHHLEVRPRSRHDWLVSYEGDPTPLSEHATQTEAVAAARNWARQFGERVIHVHELDAEIRTVAVEPDFRAPSAADVKGPSVEPPP
jgi:hypothetical protein